MSQPQESEIDDSLAVYPLQWYRRYGNCYGCLFSPSGPLMLCLLVSITLIGSLVVAEIAAEISNLAMGAGVCIVCVCVASLCAAASVNPGMVLKKPEVEVNFDSRAFCLVCEVMREAGTTHCPDCDVCIRGFDHHCPWTGKCIGAGNLLYFHCFLASILATLVYTIVCATVKSAAHRTQ